MMMFDKGENMKLLFVGLGPRDLQIGEALCVDNGLGNMRLMPVLVDQLLVAQHLVGQHHTTLATL